MTPDQASRLAALICEIRPDWQQPGVLKALGHAKHRDIADAAMAAIRWAANPECRTPGGIGMPGPHWDERVTPPKTPTPPKRGEACRLCGLHRDRCICSDGPTLTPPAAHRTPPTSAWRDLRAQVLARSEGDE